jgi:shikimate dehydrogenase
VSRRFAFIGVSTAGSSIVGVFPRWRDALGLGDDVELVGWDLPLGASAEVYRDAIERLVADPQIVGALVTTHKLGLMRAAGERFEFLDPNARLLDEVSCIAKRDGLLHGWAKDPPAAAASLEAVIGERHFGGEAEALVMGAGGAGAAIAAYLAAWRGDRPRRVIVTDRSPKRLEHMAGIARRLGDPSVLELAAAEPGSHERLLAELPERSLVVNATGMGKDRPGSPLADDAEFPRGAVAWELNYRGELDFLRQARSQAEARELVVEDGWGYFTRGWAAVIEEVFERPIGPGELELLSREAEEAAGQSGQREGAR